MFCKQCNDSCPILDTVDLIPLGIFTFEYRLIHIHMTGTSPETSQLSHHQNLYLPLADTDLNIFEEEFQGVRKASRYPFAVHKLIAKQPVRKA